MWTRDIQTYLSSSKRAKRTFILHKAPQSTSELPVSSLAIFTIFACPTIWMSSYLSTKTSKLNLRPSSPSNILNSSKAQNVKPRVRFGTKLGIKSCSATSAKERKELLARWYSLKSLLIFCWMQATPKSKYKRWCTTMLLKTSSRVIHPRMSMFISKLGWENTSLGLIQLRRTLLLSLTSSPTALLLKIITERQRF